jgi:hypothetical protein
VTNLMNNCSFTCFACNNIDHMVDNEIAHIAFSNCGDFDYCHHKHVPMNSLLDANGDVQRRRCIMMDDVFIYHAHTFFVLSMMCVGTRKIMSTSIEHELTKRALESIPHMMRTSHLLLHPLLLQPHKCKDRSLELVPNNLIIRYFRFLELYL